MDVEPFAVEKRLRRKKKSIFSAVRTTRVLSPMLDRFSTLIFPVTF
jgi:hypothetical protein